MLYRKAEANDLVVEGQQVPLSNCLVGSADYIKEHMQCRYTNVNNIISSPDTNTCAICRVAPAHCLDVLGNARRRMPSLVLAAKRALGESFRTEIRHHWPLQQLPSTPPAKPAFFMWTSDSSAQ
jgi:hypothetical protein